MRNIFLLFLRQILRIIAIYIVEKDSTSIIERFFKIKFAPSRKFLFAECLKNTFRVCSINYITFSPFLHYATSIDGIYQVCISCNNEGVVFHGLVLDCSLLKLDCGSSSFYDSASFRIKSSDACAASWINWMNFKDNDFVRRFLATIFKYT